MAPTRFASSSGEASSGPPLPSLIGASCGAVLMYPAGEGRGARQATHLRRRRAFSRVHRPQDQNVVVGDDDGPPSPRPPPAAADPASGALSMLELALVESGETRRGGFFGPFLRIFLENIRGVPHASHFFLQSEFMRVH